MPMRPTAFNDIAIGQALLSVDNVTLSFGGVTAIRNVSFDIKKGEVRAIIGPNGAGKTSMLNVINGFYQPLEGRMMPPTAVSHARSRTSRCSAA
jgi:branched-chain amino acid transport system ATP-binding protein